MNDSQTFWDLIKNAVPEGTITNFVLVCEIRESDQAELKLVTSDLMTPWLAEGMLNFGMSAIRHMGEE